MANELLIIRILVGFWIGVACYLLFRLASNEQRHARFVEQSYDYTVVLLKALKARTEQLVEALNKLNETQRRNNENTE